MIQAILLTILAAGLLIATWRDIRIREVPDLVSYGLILVGLLGGLAIALLQQDLWIFLEHLFGFAFGALVGLAMYYGRQWGGGDAKLIMGVGAIIGLSLRNLQMLDFLVLLVLCGAVYGIVMLLYLALVTHRKRFLPEFRAYVRQPKVHRIRIALVLTGVALVIAAFFVPFDVKVMLGFILLALYLLVYSWILSRIIERSVLTKDYPVGKLTEGDWIVEDVKVRGRLIVGSKSTGITREQIAALKRAKIKQVKVKEGIPFVPGFLLAFLVLLIGNYFLGKMWLLGLFF